MNYGKMFETDFKKSLGNIYGLRLKDGTASWNDSNTTRFQHYNPCDFIIHHKGFLFLTELKTHKGKSIPFKCFREKQLIELDKIRSRQDEIALAIFNFRDFDLTYICFMADVIDFIDECKKNDKRRSFPIEWVQEVGFRVSETKKKIHFNYAVEEALDNVITALNNN